MAGLPCVRGGPLSCVARGGGRGAGGGAGVAAAAVKAAVGGGADDGDAGLPYSAKVAARLFTANAELATEEPMCAAFAPLPCQIKCRGLVSALRWREPIRCPCPPGGGAR